MVQIQKLLQTRQNCFVDFWGSADSGWEPL